MLLLATDVALYLFDKRFTDREDPVPCLPFEPLQSAGSLVDPTRGFALDFLDHHGDRDICFELGKDMDMVRYPTDLQQHTTLPTDDATNILVEGFPDIVADQWDTVLGREDDVIEKVSESGSHEFPRNEPLRRDGVFFLSLLLGRGYKNLTASPRAKIGEAACAPLGLAAHSASPAGQSPALQPRRGGRRSCRAGLDRGGPASLRRDPARRRGGAGLGRRLPRGSGSPSVIRATWHPLAKRNSSNHRISTKTAPPGLGAAFLDSVEAAVTGNASSSSRPPMTKKARLLG